MEAGPAGCRRRRRVAGPGPGVPAVEEMLGVHFGESAEETVTTIAGLLSHVSGKVPAPGDKCDLKGFRFEVLEANQRKVLRVKVQKLPSAAMQVSQS